MRSYKTVRYQKERQMYFQRIILFFTCKFNPIQKYLVLTEYVWLLMTSSNCVRL